MKMKVFNLRFTNLTSKYILYRNLYREIGTTMFIKELFEIAKKKKIDQKINTCIVKYSYYEIFCMAVKNV